MMTGEEKQDLLNAINEFYDEANHYSLHPIISDKAKAVALKCMLIVQEQSLPKSLQEKIAEYKHQTGYDKMTPEERHKAGESLNKALECMPNLDNKEIMKEWDVIRHG